ncbi:MAG: phosphotransferase [Candidatus Pacebacteria bacterium]|nr:phosphotransferase [Candidatus Paceibacterota bacterium]
MTQQLIQQILTQYGFTEGQAASAKVHPTEKGYRNKTIPLEFSLPVRVYAPLPQTTRNLTKISLVLFKRESGIKKRVKNADQISTFLAKKGFPTRWPILPPGSNNYLLKISHNNQHQLAALYPYLPGKTINWEAYTQKHLKLLGQVMSLTHQALTDYHSPTLPNQTRQLQVWVSQMKAYFAQSGVKQALRKKLAFQPHPNFFSKASRLLAAVGQLSPIQPLHLDFVRSNILFNETTSLPANNNQEKLWLDFDPDKPRQLAISGLLDWEKTALGPKVIDLARTLAFLLVDCKHKPALKIKKYFLHSGYFKRGVQQPAEKERNQLVYLESLVSLFLFYDLYKFLRHNPYQDLTQNEHFVRTKKTLIQRNIIQKI